MSEIFKTRNFIPCFEIMWYFCSHIFFIAIVTVAVNSDVDFFLIVIVTIYIAVTIDVVAGYYHCRNIIGDILIKAITVNIVTYIPVTTINVTNYGIILISVITGFKDGDSGGWYIWPITLILHQLITFKLTSFMAYFKFKQGKMNKKQQNRK